MKSSFLKANLALFAVNALYGASHVIAKGVMPDFLTPSVFILFRVVGAVALFWLVKIFFIKERIQKKDLLLFAACGMFGVAINQMCFFHGLSLSSSINAGIIMTVNPILVVILSFFILKEKITVKKSVGILIAAAGAILLTLTAGTGKGDSVLGDFLLFINASSYAMYLVLVKPLMQRYSPLTVITYVFTFGLIYILLYPPTLTEFFATDYSSFTTAIVWKIIYIVVGVTFLTYLLTVYALKYLSPSVSSAYIYLQPALVIFFAFSLAAIGIAEDYTETITWEKVGYMLLIFVGVFITSKRR
ncbi:MAG: DMT family transporter [Fluviicola sp.]|nr:DMT family transporter [Fluviicola sp.]